jgi:hypothetical protein
VQKPVRLLLSPLHNHHFFELIELCGDTGSNVIVAGTAIFNAPNPEEVIQTLKATVEQAQLKRAQA